MIGNMIDKPPVDSARGEGNISAYQIMGIVGVHKYAFVMACFLAHEPIIAGSVRKPERPLESGGAPVSARYLDGDFFLYRTQYGNRSHANFLCASGSDLKCLERRC
jgi:hypothetical protein